VVAGGKVVVGTVVGGGVVVVVGRLDVLLVVLAEVLVALLVVALAGAVVDVEAVAADSVFTESVAAPSLSSSPPHAAKRATTASGARIRECLGSRRRFLQPPPDRQTRLTTAVGRSIAWRGSPIAVSSAPAVALLARR